MFINVGITSPHNASKKALREAVQQDTSQVYAYSTSFMGGQFNGVLAGLPEGVTLSAVGPDPERSRKWYASITRKGGKIIVK